MSDITEVSVTDVLVAFRTALVGLTDAADRIGLEWRDASAHDDWEALADAVFDTLVARSVWHDASTPPDSYALARYDFDLRDYRHLSWVELDDGSALSTVLVRFLTTSAPFDTVQCAIVRQGDGSVEGGTTIPFSDELQFRVRLRSESAVDSVREDLTLSD